MCVSVCMYMHQIGDSIAPPQPLRCWTMRCPRNPSCYFGSGNRTEIGFEVGGLGMVGWEWMWGRGGLPADFDPF